MNKSVVKKQNKRNVKNIYNSGTNKVLTNPVPDIVISDEKIMNNKEDRTISTPISIQLLKENSKMDSYTKVKQFLDNFTSSFVEYGRYLYFKYKEENNDFQYTKIMKKSYLRNVRFILNPTWSDMNHDYEYPNYQTLEGLNEIFYMIDEEKKNSWVFQGVESITNDSNTTFDAFESLLNGTYHDEFMVNNDRNYHYFKYYLDILKNIFNKKNNDYTKDIYHIGSLLQISDGKTSLYQPYTNVESCIATKNMIMMIHSLRMLKQKNILKALDSIGFEYSDINLYMEYIVMPFFGVLYAYRHLEMNDELLEIDSDIYNYQCITNPQSTWLDIDPDFDEDEYRKEREEAMKLHRAKLALKEEERLREISKVDFYDLPLPQGPAPILNKRFAEKLAEEKAAAAASTVKSSPTASLNSRASAFISETDTNKNNSPTTSTVVSDSTNKHTYVPHDFVFEENKIPKSMKRNERNETSGRDTGFLIFHAGTLSDHVYERAAIATHGGKHKCSIKDVCAELPRLLVEKEKFLRKSRDKVFGKSLEELFRSDVQNRKLYYTNLRRAIISFCNEIAATTRFDNNGRMAILEKYYGVRKSTETEKMYVDSFMYDVFRPFINFYNYVKTL